MTLNENLKEKTRWLWTALFPEKPHFSVQMGEERWRLAKEPEKDRKLGKKTAVWCPRAKGNIFREWCDWQLGLHKRSYKVTGWQRNNPWHGQHTVTSASCIWVEWRRHKSKPSPLKNGWGEAVTAGSSPQKHNSEKQRIETLARGD